MILPTRQYVQTTSNANGTKNHQKHTSCLFYVQICCRIYIWHTIPHVHTIIVAAIISMKHLLVYLVCNCMSVVCANFGLALFGTKNVDQRGQRNQQIQDNKHIAFDNHISGEDTCPCSLSRTPKSGLKQDSGSTQTQSKKHPCHGLGLLTTLALAGARTGDTLLHTEEQPTSCYHNLKSRNRKWQVAKRDAYSMKC